MSESPPRNPQGTAGRVAAILAPVLAVGLVVIGAVLVSTSATPSSFGWFAYAPLSDATFSPSGLIVLSAAGTVGAVLVIVGLVLLAFWSGFRTAHRARH